MATQNATPKNAIILFFFLFILAVITETTFSQDCKENKGCPGVKECCSDWGYCGKTDEHCGFWCWTGPCNITTSTRRTGLNAGPCGKIESVVTPALYNKIMSKVGNNCTGKEFYNREAFITAVKSFGHYKNTIAIPIREIAAILTHFSYGSGSFCYKEEIVKKIFCSSSKKYPCEPGKKYYGRGPIQTIRWNEYYGAAGKYLGLPLLKDPDMVARSPEVAFKFAMWFWKTRVRPAVSHGFGATTKRIDGTDCDGFNPGTERIKKYLEFCKLLGVSPGEEDSLVC